MYTLCMCMHIHGKIQNVIAIIKIFVQYMYVCMYIKPWFSIITQILRSTRINILFIILSLPNVGIIIGLIYKRMGSPGCDRKEEPDRTNAIAFSFPFIDRSLLLLCNESNYLFTWSSSFTAPNFPKKSQAFKCITHKRIHRS